MKKFKCVLSCFLCLALLLCVGLRPITARAVVGETVVIGAFGATASVPVALVGLVVIVIALGISGTLDDAIEEAERLYNSASATVKSWYEGLYQQVIDGTSVFKIPTVVQQEFDEQQLDENKKLPAGLPYLMFPASLIALETLSKDDVFAQSATDAILQGNELTAQSNNLLGSIRSFLGYAFDGLTSSISSLGNAISVQYGKIEEWLSTLNSNFDAELQQMKDLSFAINNNVMSDIQQLKNLSATINTNMKSELQQLKNLSFAINNNMQVKFNELRTAVTSSITTAVDNVGVKIDSVVTAITAVAGSGSGGEDEDTKKIVVGGINHALPFFGSGKDYLAEYSSGFLVAGMIFNEFADIPIINKLLFVSVTIGIIGVVLGIALNVAQSDKSARGKKSKAGVT